MVRARECDCIVLAAGLSSRMSGSKMLRPVAGKPLVRLAVEHALCSCRRVIVVLGHLAEAVREAAAGGIGEAVEAGRSPTDEQGVGSRLLFVHNASYREGMVGSIRRGMHEVRSDWFFIVPGDMPALTPQIFQAVASAAGRRESTPAVVPFYRETRGHPVLVHRSLIPHLLSEERGGGPMRDLLARYPVDRLQLDDPAVTQDVDTDADYRRLTESEE